MTLSLRILVCEHIYPELVAVAKSPDFVDVEIASYPARCGLPLLEWREIKEILPPPEQNQRIEIIGSYCLSKLSDPTGGYSSCTIHKKEQCFNFFVSQEVIDRLQRKGAYLMTPGWLANWQKHLNIWGFDQQGAQAFFQETIQHLFLLDTGVATESSDSLQNFAAFIGLPHKTEAVGLDFFQLYLATLVLKARLQHAEDEVLAAQKISADYAMALDLVSQLGHATTEIEVEESIVELFSMLFGPQKINYIPIKHGALAQERLAELSSQEQEVLKKAHSQSEEIYDYSTYDDGFWLRIGNAEEQLAILLLSKVAFPEYQQLYLNLAIHIAEVCALAISHIRTLRQLIDVSRKAGKAELATEVLHNVGNVLNSVRVSVEYISERVDKSVTRTLPDIIKMMQDHADNLAHFLEDDDRGSKLLLYFSEIAKEIVPEKSVLLQECHNLIGHIEHVGRIIETEHSLVKDSALIETFSLADLLEESVTVQSTYISGNEIEVIRDYSPFPPVKSQPHKILQILINLLTNAVDALLDKEDMGEKRIVLRLKPHNGDSVRVEVCDNGMGILPENLKRIFMHGFTTKAKGHGFGLHSAANLATELGGRLFAMSDGVGKGSTFCLDLPLAIDQGAE